MSPQNLFVTKWTGPTGFGHIGVEVVPADPTHPGARRLIEYWQSKRRDGALPLWTSIGPRELGPLLPWLLLAEPEDNDWRYRLFGTGLAARCGLDWSRQFVRDVYNEPTALECARMYAAVTGRHQPIHLRGRYLGIDIEHATIEAVHLPVIGRDGRTVWVFGGVFFMDENCAGAPAFPRPGGA